ncbi:MAG: sulfatase-like hydrolase/transferase [Gimesia sp.]
MTFSGWMMKTVTSMFCVFVFSVLITPVLASPKQPNVVFFLVDDLGWRDVGCFGSTFYETPNIDRLAHQGRRFT